MSRRPSFRKDKDIQKEIRRINKLVQNKQSRLRVNKGLEVQGVETTKFKEFHSRREINKYLNQMNKFLEKKADFRVTNEKGANLQYSEVQQMERTIERVNRQKKEQWNKFKGLEYKHNGQPTGLTVEQVADPDIGIGHPKFSDFKPLKFNPGRFRTEKEFREWVQDKRDIYGKTWLEDRNQLYKENYIRSLQNNLGNASQHIQKFIDEMDMDTFIKEYYSENNAHIDFVYDKVSIKARVTELNRVWGIGGE